MSLTALRRSTAAVVAVAAGAGVAALPVFQAHADTRAATSLSIRTAHAAVKPGGSERVSGDLEVHGTASPEGRTVTLEARPTGTDSFVPVGTAVARLHGGLTLKVTPDVTTRYRWHYAGDTDARPSQSGVATIRVRVPQHAPRRIRTSLSVRAVHRVVRQDGSDVVRGHLRAGRVPLGHRDVLLVSHTQGEDGWTFEGDHRTRRDGGVAFEVNPSEPTAYRLVFLGTPLLRPARSGVVRVLDRPDVTIAADPTTLTRGDSTTISGTASDEGTPVAGASVQLLARKAGARHLKVLETGMTADDGSVSFTESPAVTTMYRIRLVHATGVRASLSQPVRVHVLLPSSLSIRGRATTTDYVVSGTLRGGGHQLAHRTVTLQMQASGSADWTDAGTAKTGKAGVVRFHEPTAPGTSYRLVYAGGPRFAPSTSGTVVS
ncbi:MAG: hypothetical protein QM747_21215 [Nocardioides sp.]